MCSSDLPVARALREAAPAARARQVAPPKDNEGGVVQRAGESTSACIAEEPLPQFGSTDESPDPLAALAATLEGLAPAIPSSKSNPPGPRSVPMALRALIAELGTGAAPPRLPLNGSLHPNSAAEPPLSRDKLSMPLPAPIDDATRPFGAKLLPLAWAMAKPEAPGTPQLGLAPSLASLTHYNPLDGHPLRPSQPLRNVRKTDCGPRLTLAGPTLPPALLRFEDRVFNPIPATSWKPRKRFLPGWAMTASIACTVLVAGINGVFSGSRPATPPPPAQVEAAPSEAVPPPPPPNTASPLAKAIEVTGLRIEMSPEKKSEIRYLVVNHTANELGGLTVYVTLHGGHAPAGQPALGR